MKLLNRFPEEFQPLVVVTGDRREVPPRSKGDVLAYSFSTTDIMYLPHLNTPSANHSKDSPLVLSDKQFAIDSEEALQRRFGKTNILVVGSPAVNFLARRINDRCMFRFSISEETKKELDEQNYLLDNLIQDDEDSLYIYHQCLEGILDIDTILARIIEKITDQEAFYSKAQLIISEFRKTMICRDPKTYPRPIRYLMHKLDKPGIYDSLSDCDRGVVIGPHRDYGLITVLSNPFSMDQDYYIVYVAGVHGPGTAMGLRMLGSKEAFTRHPYGGVYDVNINSIASYFERIQISRANWETRGYTTDEYAEKKRAIITGAAKQITAFMSTPSRREDEQQKEFDKGLRELLVEVCNKEGLVLNIQDPYTFPYLADRHDFWVSILEYEKKCHFILHDVTGCAHGVMVEIGFSIGTRRQYFLIWNEKKVPWSAMHAPSLLPVTQIEPIALANPDVKNVLLTRIVERGRKGEKHLDCVSCKPLNRSTRTKYAFIYASEPVLTKSLDEMLRNHGVDRIMEDASKEQLRLCRVCQALGVADFVLIQLSNDDPNGFIILGMAKAMERKTLTLKLAKFNEEDFPWAKESVKFHIENIEQQLAAPVSNFLNF